MLIISAIAFIFFSQLFFVLNFYSFVGSNGGTEGDFSTALKFKKEAIEFIVSDSNSKNVPVYHDFLCKQEPRLEYKYLFDVYRTSLSTDCENTRYAIIDAIHDKRAGVQGTGNISRYLKFDFGPMVVYKIPPSKSAQ